MAVATILQKTKVQQVAPGANGVSVFFPALTTAQSTIVAVVAGRRTVDPYSFANLPTTAPVASVANSSPHAMAQQAAIFNFAKLDGSLSMGADIKAALDGYFPSVQLLAEFNEVGGNNEVLISGLLNANQQLIYAGGIAIWAYEVGGVLAAPSDGVSAGASGANPALAGAGFITVASGDLIFNVGLQLNGQGVGIPAGDTILDQDNLLGSTVSICISAQTQVAAGAYQASRSNPVYYDVFGASLALKHS